MYRLLFTALTALVLIGCNSTTCSSKKCAEPVIPFDELDESAQFACIADEMQLIGAALQAYRLDHNNTLPPKLSDLVRLRYITANALISSADPSNGTEGGVPDAYTEWGQATEADEPGCSYLYEFNAAPCKWDWSGYLAGNPSATDLDTNRDGVVSWAELKSWQLSRGDTVSSLGKPYSPSQFPVLRCYWYRYPKAYEDISEKSIVNLAFDLKTIFLSQPWWEKDHGDQ